VYDPDHNKDDDDNDDDDDDDDDDDGGDAGGEGAGVGSASKRRIGSCRNVVMVKRMWKQSREAKPANAVKINEVYIGGGSNPGDDCVRMSLEWLIRQAQFEVGLGEKTAPVRWEVLAP
jgi:hypothetical protein